MLHKNGQNQEDKGAPKFSILMNKAEAQCKKERKKEEYQTLYCWIESRDNGGTGRWNGGWLVGVLHREAMCDCEGRQDRRQLSHK